MVCVGHIDTFGIASSYHLAYVHALLALAVLRAIRRRVCLVIVGPEDALYDLQTQVKQRTYLSL
jgi:hypothetical protein